MNVTRTHLRFNSRISKTKPESIRNRETACPFCDRENLTDILAEKGSILWVKNKYPVLEDTFPTVLIETDQCDADLSTYSKDHLHEVIRFGMDKWRELEESGEFTSVMFFKNHGPYSGGSIHHAHMQIIGLHQIDYMQHIRETDFEGLPIDIQPGIECNVSTQPRVGFYEFNVIMTDHRRMAQFADYIQMLAHFILHHFNRSCLSYNLFFYRLGERIMVKVVPRFVTSPLYVGYSIPQVPNNLLDVVRDIQTKYLID
jgi:ATP adenylyltransferase/5',5'''-P-1,P-4-tetraphosphate phosphorylase II